MCGYHDVGSIHGGSGCARANCIACIFSSDTWGRWEKHCCHGNRSPSPLVSVLLASLFLTHSARLAPFLSLSGLMRSAPTDEYWCSTVYCSLNTYNTEIQSIVYICKKDLENNIPQVIKWKSYTVYNHIICICWYKIKKTINMHKKTPPPHIWGMAFLLKLKNHYNIYPPYVLHAYKPGFLRHFNLLFILYMSFYCVL